MCKLAFVGRKLIGNVLHQNILWVVQNVVSSSFWSKDVFFCFFSVQTFYFLVCDSYQHVPEIKERRNREGKTASDHFFSSRCWRIEEVVRRDQKLFIWWKRNLLTQFLQQRSLNFHLFCSHTKLPDHWQAVSAKAYINLDCCEHFL